MDEINTKSCPRHSMDRCVKRFSLVIAVRSMLTVVRREKEFMAVSSFGLMMPDRRCNQQWYGSGKIGHAWSEAFLTRERLVPVKREKAAMDLEDALLQASEGVLPHDDEDREGLDANVGAPESGQ